MTWLHHHHPRQEKQRRNEKIQKGKKAKNTTSGFSGDNPTPRRQKTWQFLVLIMSLGSHNGKKEIKKANDQSTCMKKENHEKAKRDQNTQSCDETIPVENKKARKKEMRQTEEMGKRSRWKRLIFTHWHAPPSRLRTGCRERS